MNSKKRCLIVAGILSALFVFSAQAEDARSQNPQAQNSPVGLWKNIDDVTGKPKALIRITENNGVLSGKIEKLFVDAGEDQNPLCTKCDGANKDKPILGMVILVGLKKEGDEYNGGTILDPDEGKLYKSKLKLEAGAKKLTVRGYIGFSWIGRSQVWVREM